MHFQNKPITNANVSQNFNTFVSHKQQFFAGPKYRYQQETSLAMLFSNIVFVENAFVSNQGNMVVKQAVLMTMPITFTRIKCPETILSKTTCGKDIRSENIGQRIPGRFPIGTNNIRYDSCGISHTQKLVKWCVPFYEVAPTGRRRLQTNVQP